MGYYKDLEIAQQDKEYNAEYSYLLFLYGDVFKNVLKALHTQKDKRLRIPKRYEEASFATVDFYNRWFGGKKNER